MALGDSLELQPVARTETRTTKLFKERAAEAVSRQILALAEGAVPAITSLKLGPDSRLRWADASRAPTLADREALLYLIGTFEHQVGYPIKPRPPNTQHQPS